MLFVINDSMLSLHLNPVNVSLPTHFHSTSSSLIYLVFVNDMTKVLLYDKISTSCFSNHHLLFLTYNLSTSSEDRYITYRDFKSIDFTVLSSSVDNICWNRIYSLDNVNDQVALIQENVRLLYDSCIPVKTKLVKANHQLWFNAEIKTLIDKLDFASWRWKRFRTDDLKAVHKSARSEVEKT